MKKLMICCLLLGLGQNTLAGTEDAHLLNMDDIENPQCIDSELPYEGFLSYADKVMPSSLEGLSLVTIEGITSILAKDGHTCKIAIEKISNAKSTP